jgi:GxxExxY protein
VPDYIHAELTRLIIGAFFDLYNELGHGFNERVYRNALAVLLRERGTSVVVEQPVVVNFHGVRVGTFCVDLVVNGKVLVEVKASRQLEPRDEAQILNYLKAAGGGIGLLVNFGPQITHRRFAMGDPMANLPNLGRTTE